MGGRETPLGPEPYDCTGPPVECLSFKLFLRSLAMLRVRVPLKNLSDSLVLAVASAASTLSGRVPHRIPGPPFAATRNLFFMALPVGAAGVEV